MKKSDMAECLVVIYMTWPNIVVSEPLVSLWLIAFPDAAKDEFMLAAVAALKIGNNGFPITIDKVNDALIILRTPVSEQITEGEAWGLLLKTMAMFGRHQPTLAFKFLEERSPRVAAVANQIGWSIIAEWRTETMGVERAHFWRMYQSIEKRDRKRDTLGMERISPAVKELMISGGGAVSEGSMRLGQDLKFVGTDPDKKPQEKKNGTRKLSTK